MSNVEDIRNAIVGSDRAFPKVIEGGKGKNPPPPQDADGSKRCPVTPLGHFDGRFFFLDSKGQKRDLAARALGGKHDLISLFLGDDTWLRDRFPKKIPIKRKGEDGEEITEEVVVDFLVNRAAAWFQAQCGFAGLFGNHIKIRVPGVWPGENHLPVVHCGDMVLIGGEWRDAGHRTGNNVWALADAVPRPDIPCEAAVARALQEDLQAYFNFRQAGGAVVVLGLLGTAYFGAVAKWRSAGFLLGPAGCGKSSLLDILAACCPMHEYSNDTTKAGLEQALDGRAMPCFLDETEKSGDTRAATALLDMVLTASGARGTQGRRGGADGRGRTIEMVASIIMAATAAPDMKETHLGRFALVHLEKPKEGEDFRAQHAGLVERMKGQGSALWGRALSSWERYNVALERFRVALGESGCAPREMDQMGAILAGWWILTSEGVPDARGVAQGIGAIPGFIRTVSQVEEQSNSRRLVNYLMTKSVQLDRSSAREPLGSLIEKVMKHREPHAMESFRDADMEATGALTARHALTTHGIRVIRAVEPKDQRGREAPRLGAIGVWINTTNTELLGLVSDTEWSGSRMETGLRELLTARKSEKSIKVGTACKPVWVGWEDLGLDEPTEPADDPPPAPP